MADVIFGWNQKQTMREREPGHFIGLGQRKAGRMEVDLGVDTKRAKEWKEQNRERKLKLPFHRAP